ncbi:hypothetical protein [Spirillospora sp. NPDC047279]|uniref:hypothetical protein n=1 Tax=Spirillospora sp. NPDC047279 TaxID=3155478 RepID=UPI0033CEA6E3
MIQTPTATRRPWLRFTWHYIEMIIAMFVGMGVLGLLFALAGVDPSYETHPEAAYLLMAFNMSVGMAAIMRFRGHGWHVTLEMCAVMFAPAVLFPLIWLDTMDGMTFMMIAHVAMFPLMLALMFLRRDEYLHHHH